MMIYKSKKSQSILDFVLVFGILLIFLVGLVRIWVWFNANYAKRNVDYQVGNILDGNVGRLRAGKPNDATAGVYRDKTFTLNDDWIFEGKPKPGERVGLLPLLVIPAEKEQDGLDDSESDNSDCSNARESATNMRNQANFLILQARIIGEADCPHHNGGSCRAAREQAQVSLREQATTLQDAADNIEMTGCGSI